MRSLRVFFIVCFLLSAMTSAASAAGLPDRAVGFVQLLSAVNPAAPVALQTEQARLMLLPELLAARQRGQIVSFEISPSTGVLKFVYRPSLGTPDIQGRTVYSDMHQAMSAVNLAAAGDIHIAGGHNYDVHLFDNTFTGDGLLAGALVRGTLFNAAGQVVARSHDFANGSGHVDGVFQWQGPTTDIFPGYKVTFAEYNGSSLIQSYPSKVPDVEFTAIDKANAVVHGKGQPGKSLVATTVHTNWDAGNTFLQRTVVTTAASTGAWTVDFGKAPLHGNDYLQAELHQNGDFTYRRWMYLPHLFCVLHTNQCDLTGLPSTAATIQIVHGGVLHTFAGTFSTLGFFDGFMTQPNGTPIGMNAGDKVSGTGVAQYPLPKLSVTGLDPVANVVSGHAPANKYFQVWVRQPNTGAQWFVYTHSDTTGAFAADFTSQQDLQSGILYVAWINYIVPAAGSQTAVYNSFDQ